MSDFSEIVTSFSAYVTSSSLPYDQNFQVDASNLDDYMWIYFSPIILILGLCGNILTMAVMRRKRLRGTTTSVYMPVMAVFDTIALCYGIVPEWFNSMRVVTFRDIHPFFCKQEKFVFYTASDSAIWVLVLFTVDRFVAVSFPLHKNRVCVPRRSKIACVVVFVLCVLKNVHVFWTRGVEVIVKDFLVNNCGKPDPYFVFETKYRPWIALALISILPFCILLICNCFIISRLAKASRRQLQVRRLDSQALERTKTFKQTTMMCLSASFVFLVCVIPSIVMLIGKPYWGSTSNFSYEIAKAVNNQLAYFNHSINFFLYCLTGQKFRSELVAMMAQVRRSIRYSDSTVLGTSRATMTSALRSVNMNAVDPAKVNVKVQAAL